MQSFYHCGCYFTNNIYIHTLKAHFRFIDYAQFKLDYFQVWQQSWQSNISFQSLVEQVENEVTRRRKSMEDQSLRISKMKSLYQPKLGENGTVNIMNDWIHPELHRIVKTLDEDGALELYRVYPDHLRVYRLPVWTEEFCDLLNEEIGRFLLTCADLVEQPNTMNHFGAKFDEMGLDDLIAEMRELYLAPVLSKLFPEWVSHDTGLDSHKAFTIKYDHNETAGDKDLGFHFDNSELSVSICLTSGKDITGSQLYFCSHHSQADDRLGLAGTSTDQLVCGTPPLDHRKGWGFFHRGRQYHGTLPIKSGQRQSLIIWFRSSGIRNQLCPMCWSKPDQLVPGLKDSYADGFTIPPDPNSVNVCALL